MAFSRQIANDFDILRAFATEIATYSRVQQFLTWLLSGKTLF